MVLAGCFFALASGDSALAQLPSGIERLAWLQGCWEAKMGNRIVEEHWMAPRGNTMIGVGRTTGGAGELMEYELVVIRQSEDHIVYEAHPSGQPSAQFFSVNVAQSRLVFESLKHDFPQRIGYERKGDALQAWIEGVQSGKPRRIDFSYKRASCGPA